jgi:hypothetical protein
MAAGTTDVKLFWQGENVPTCSARGSHEPPCSAHMPDDAVIPPIILVDTPALPPHDDTNTYIHTHTMPDQPFRPSHEDCVVLRKSSDMPKHLIKQWNALSDDDPHDVYRGRPHQRPKNTSAHEWIDDTNASCPNSRLHTHAPQELHFTAPNDNLLLAHARLITAHVTSKPLTTLYDPGFSGEIMMSQSMASKLHLPIEPVNQPIILADGTTVPCGGLVRNVRFCPTESFCELVDILVFPLATHDILVSMSWMQKHHVHISCAARALGFWARECTDRTAYNQHHIRCTSTPHSDVASLANVAMLNMLTCNQFKKFLKDDLDVETCTVFSKTHQKLYPYLLLKKTLAAHKHVRT